MFGCVRCDRGVGRVRDMSGVHVYVVQCVYSLVGPIVATIVMSQPVLVANSSLWFSNHIDCVVSLFKFKTDAL